VPTQTAKGKCGETMISIKNICNGVEMAIFLKNLVENLKVCFNWNRKNSPSSKAVAKNKQGGHAIAISGNDNKVTWASDSKELAVATIQAAIADLNYNGPYVGNSKVPFKYTNVEKMLCLPSSYELSEDTQIAIHVYLRNVGLCNGNTGKPVWVQQESKRLITILQCHLQSLNHN